MAQEGNGEPFEISSQGCLLRGYILRPHESGKHPTVILSHGFLGSTKNTKVYATFFAEKGYAVLYYDFCMSGSGQSTGSSTCMSVLTEKTDLINVLHYFHQIERRRQMVRRLARFNGLLEWYRS